MSQLDSGKLDKAYIYNEDTGQEVVKCLFNPTDYSFTKTNTWQRDSTGTGNVPMLSFRGGGDMSLTVALTFDTYNMEGRPDVRTYTEKVVELMRVADSTKDSNSQAGRPPRVSFRWGTSWFFKSVITNLTQRFTMFMPDGRPVRAVLNVTFTQVEQEGSDNKPTNPTSLAEAHKVRTIGPGETIDSIAFDEYGDASRWKLIADYNDLDDPLRLRPGQRLAIPPAS